MSTPCRRPVVLIIRDGWGSNPHPEWNHANAIHLARKPVDDRLMATYPHGLIRTCGEDVGLPHKVMGNSEVGHQNIGAGRVVEQEIMRITGRIRDGSFFDNRTLVTAFERAAASSGRVHLLGLCSDGRVHSDLDHLFGLLEMARRAGFRGDHVFVHAITDGRDTPPESGLEFVRRVEEQCRGFGTNPVASVIGRFYAMDRDNRWDRVEAAYRLLVGANERAASGNVAMPATFDSSVAAIQHYYAHPTEASMRGDEFITPSATLGSRSAESRIRDGDSVVFFNYRGDRPRELTKAFVADPFPFDGPATDGPPQKFGFDRGRKPDVHFVTMTAYEAGLPVHVAFDKPPRMEDILGAYLSKLHLRQFRCAETEKYPHVTFFFNDYRDEPFPGEARMLIPSPRDVPTYDHKPQMSAYEVAHAVVERLASGIDDLVVVNFANGDMVGHTGNLKAAVRAVEAVDECVGRILDATLARGGSLVITADHGNCEQMIDPATGGPHTAHTTYDVELIVVDPRYLGRAIRPGGRLADIAPTLLELMNLPQPPAMTGQSLVAAR